MLATLSCSGGAPQSVPGQAGVLGGFRSELYRCLTRRGDALFEVADAVLCGPGRVRDLARLSLAAGRGHGAVYDGLNAGRVDVGRLRRAVASVPLPCWADGRIRLAVDVSSWLRPEAVTSPQRLFCHVQGRGKNAGQRVPGWPYSFVSVLGPGRSSWQVLVDAVRLGPRDDLCEVTAAQIREVVVRLIAAGHWKQGSPRVLVALDAGYNPARLTWLLKDLPVTLAVRVRSGRVFARRAPARPPGLPGRAAVHGAPVKCADPATWDGAALMCGQHPQHGPVQVMAWQAVHQRLDRSCGGWEDWPPGTPLPAVEGTLIRVHAAWPAGDGDGAMWLWASDPDASAEEVAACWQAYLRRFDIEHAFRFLKQQLGWDKPLLRDPAAADRWTWLLIACWAQLWLARPLAADLRLPWQPALPAAALTPGRVRAAFTCARETAGSPVRAPKPSRPGPGRPKGSRNTRKAPRHPVGKPVLKPHSEQEMKRKQAKRSRRENQPAG